MTFAKACFATVALLCLVAVAQGQANTSSNVQYHPAPSSCPYLHHVIVVMLENKPASLIRTKPDLVPNILKMYNTYSPAIQYYGYTHYSEPNYIAITSGTNACAHSDNDNVFYQQSIFDQLTSVGKTWKCYMQSIPSPGFNGSSSSDGRYARKHNPCAMYASTAAQAANSIEYSNFKTDLATGNLPAFSFIAPDQCNDMHGTPSCHLQSDELIQAGDAWTADFWATLTSSTAWKTKHVLVAFVYDEDDYSTTAGCCGSPLTPNHGTYTPVCSWNNKCDNDGITPATCPEQFHLGDTPFATSTSTYGGGLTLATFAYSGAQGRCVLDYPMNHLSVLKTIQYCWGLPILANANFPNVPYLDGCIFQ